MDGEYETAETDERGEEDPDADRGQLGASLVRPSPSAL
jgi:hypothetical protein